MTCLLNSFSSYGGDFAVDRVSCPARTPGVESRSE